MPDPAEIHEAEPLDGHTPAEAAERGLEYLAELIDKYGRGTNANTAGLLRFAVAYEQALGQSLTQRAQLRADLDAATARLAFAEHDIDNLEAQALTDRAMIAAAESYATATRALITSQQAALTAALGRITTLETDLAALAARKSVVAYGAAVTPALTLAAGATSSAITVTVRPSIPTTGAELDAWLTDETGVALGTLAVQSVTRTTDTTATVTLRNTGTLALVLLVGRLRIHVVARKAGGA